VASVQHGEAQRSMPRKRGGARICTKPKVHWKDDEHEVVKQELSRLMFNYSHGGKMPSFFILIEEAQNVLPDQSRRRDIRGWSQVPKRRKDKPGEWKADVEKRVEKFRKTFRHMGFNEIPPPQPVTNAVPAPAPEPKMATAVEAAHRDDYYEPEPHTPLTDNEVRVAMERIEARQRATSQRMDALVTVLLGIFTRPSGQKPEELIREPEIAHALRVMSKPKVLCMGVKPGQERLVAGNFAGDLDLDFIHSDKGAGNISNAQRYDHVVSLHFIDHSHFRTIISQGGPKPIVVRGTSRMQQELARIVGGFNGYERLGKAAH
jgi:hypothetical protein